jgi:ATP-dependent DNA helicase RecQ
VKVAKDPLGQALRRHFGWQGFRPGQRQVVEALLEGRDCLAVLPTGAGKSLCYQLPALVREGVVVVVSPLVALMQDQVAQLRRRGIAASCLHGGQTAEEQRSLGEAVQAGRLRLLYLAPERLRTESTRAMLAELHQAGRLVALAVDEAHCISAWGHDFRPDYRRLGDLRRLCPGLPLVALSATASPRVRAEIIRLLRLSRPLVQVRSARRDNLHYAMRRRPPEALPAVLEEVGQARGAVLIYARTRRSVEDWAVRLAEAGLPTAAYHAGMDAEHRQAALAFFQADPSPVLVATIAFGMGLDRPDVGLVLHLDLPASAEGYLQESGRAGRDGGPARCVVLFDPADRVALGWAIRAAGRRTAAEGLEPALEARAVQAQRAVRQMEAVAEGEDCREQALLRAVGEVVDPCGRCDNCLASSQRRDWSTHALRLLETIEAADGADLRSLRRTLETGAGAAEPPWGWLARRLVQEELIGESDDGVQRLWLRASGRHFLRCPWPLHWAA